MTATTFDSALASMKNDATLGDGWTWSRATNHRASSNKWLLTARYDGTIEIEPSRAMRGPEKAVRIVVGEYPVLKVVLLTYIDDIEHWLNKYFEENQR